MDVNNTNSVRDEQFDDAKSNIEITVEVEETATETVNENESETTIEKIEVDAEKDENQNQKIEIEVVESSNEDVSISAETEELTEKIEVVDFSNEEALIAAESEEFDLDDDGEIDSEEETEISSDFSNMNKAELVTAFRTILETQPVEKIRKDIDAIKTSFYKILRQEQDAYKQEYLEKGNDIESYVAPIDKDEIEFKSLFNSYKNKRSIYLRNLENNKEENYKIKLKLIDELKVLIDKKENINRTFQEFKELQRRWHETGPIPQACMKDLWDTYNHHVEIFYDYLKINKELRDMDFKKNLEAKIQLCEKTEELLLEPSVVNAFRKLQKYHEQWRETGPVANELKEQIWERFKEATSKINKKHQEYFEQQKETHEQNFKAKIILCEKIEELLAAENKTNKEWNKSSKALVEMQKAWKSIGFASKKDNVKIYLRFRKACDEFFNSKRKFYGEFKKSMEDNLRLKLNLCEQAEALSKSSEWKKTTEQFMKLQKEWREIGIVPRKVSATTWKRFRTACDTFFHNRNSTLREQDSRYDENLKAKEAIISEIKGYKADANVVKNLDAIKEFQRRWAAIGYVPIKEKSRVQSEYRNALDNLFKVLNISEKDRKIVKFKTRLESAQSGKGQIKSLRNERDKLLGQIRQIEADIALWENNIGFFAKSKNADTVVSEVKRKIERGKEEVIILEEKIKLLDQTI
jgi:triphosphoribosyl-dephospho-CoA synthetase